MIAKSDAVGIDAPFGWPTEFSVAVSAWGFNRGYKKNTDDHEQARKNILDRLCKAMPWVCQKAAPRPAMVSTR